MNDFFFHISFRFLASVQIFYVFVLVLLLETCSIAYFYKQRPEHIELISGLPQNMCLCSYHANFIEAVYSLHKTVPDSPDYDHGFVQLFVCEGSPMDCWYGVCNECTGVTVPKLTDLIGDTLLDSDVSWMVWRKNTQANRVEKREETGTLATLIAHTAALSSQFLKHSFNKREQSEMFNAHDRPRALNVEFPDEGLLQVDFAENFVCEAQDGVQNAH